jgi:hypothetical protein
MSAPLSPEVSGLLTQLSELSSGLKNGQPGAREGLMGACSALISELAHPMESILMLTWAQVGFKPCTADFWVVGLIVTNCL